MKTLGRLSLLRARWRCLSLVAVFAALNLLQPSRAAGQTETLFVSIEGFAGGLPGNDASGNGSRLAPYREISRAMQFVFANNTHVIFVGPSRGGFYSGQISTPFDHALKIVSEKGADSTLLTSTNGYTVVNLNADSILQILEGFTIANSVLNNCEGTCSGGVAAYGHVWIINNMIVNNVGTGGGGGINFWGIPGYGGVIAGNAIGGNSDPNLLSGGGIQVDNSSSLSIINNTIVSNASFSGAGIRLSASAAGVTIANNIIAYNQVGYGIYQVDGPSPPISNNLFFQNTPGDVSGPDAPDGTNIIDADPLVANQATNDYHLTCSSPARNQGSNSLVPAEIVNSGDFAWDLDGPPQGRYFQTTIDIGADEFWDTNKMADFDATSTVGCNSLAVNFANHSTCIDDQWLWDFGDSTTSIETNPVHNYAAPGLYTVRLIASRALGSDTLTRNQYIRVADSLTVDFTADAVIGCSSLTVTFAATVNTPADSLRWSFGDGGFALGSPVAHTYTGSGNRTVELRGYNACGVSLKSKPAYIVLDCSLKAGNDTLFVSVDGFPGGFPGNDTSGTGSRLAPYRQISRAMQVVISRNAHVIFVGPSRGSSYSGQIRTPSNRLLKIVSEKGADSTYLTDPSGFSVISLYADSTRQILEGFTIADKPGLLSCEGPCSGAVNAFGRVWIINNKILRNAGDGLGGGINYYGVLGSTGIIAGNWIADNSDPGTESGAGIHVDFSTSLSIVNNTIVANTAQSGAGIRLSETASGVTIANNIIAYNKTGYGIYQQQTSSSKRSGDVVVNPAAATVKNNEFYKNASGLVFGMPAPDGTNITGVSANPFLADPTGGDYHLTCGSPARNSGSNTQVPTELFSSGEFVWDVDGPPQGRYFQTTIDIGGDEFWDTNKRADFDATPTVGCNQLVASFANHSTCVDEHWTWDFGDHSGLLYDVKNPTHLYNVPGVYTVKLIARGDLDSNTLTRVDFIRVVTPLGLTFTADSVKACNALTATFTAQINGDADSLRWVFGDGGTAVSNPVTHTYSKIGTFNVELRAYNACGPVLSSRLGYITVGTKPEISIAASSDSLPPPRCTPYTVRLHPITNQHLDKWEWDFGDSDTTGTKLSDPSHTYDHDGTYSVRLIASGDCGSDTAIRLDYVQVNSRPTATLNASPRAVCAAGQSVAFTATYGGTVDSSRWLFGDGGTAPGPNAGHVYPGQGIYQPSLILFHACATDTLPLNSTVGVGISPQAALYGAPRAGLEPLNTQFADSSRNGPTSWQWLFGDGATSADRNPAHIYSAGIWDVTLTVTNVCGNSADLRTQYVRVGGFRPSIDSSGVRGDSILYSVLVDTLFRAYDRPVSLSGAFTTTPRRGSAGFQLDASSGTPKFTTTMKVIPSGDLATGDYTVRLSAIDPRITKSADRTLHFIGHKFIDVTPDTLQFGKQAFGGPYSKQAYVHNRAPLGSGYALNFSTSDSGQGFTARTSAVINPQESTVVQVAFSPSRRGEYLGALIVTSDDPAATRSRIVLHGFGAPELILPRVSATVPSLAFGEVRIDSAVRFAFSEPVVAPSADSLVIVSAKRSASRVNGHLTFSSGSVTRPWVWLAFSPISCEWFPPDDTLRFRVRAVITDTSANGLDGNLNANDEGSPADDYLFSVSTGPGVRPGDADQNLRVDERDILPLARYWGMTGPPRENACDGFVVQPASPWVPRDATHADADGNGVIDSADICPIVQYFDIVAVLPKSAVETWMSEAKKWDKSIIRSLSNGLINCPDGGAGKSTLHRFLEDIQSAAAVPAEYSLNQNYPNPFNPTTVVEYTLKTRTQVRLEVFDIVGRLVTVLEDGEQEPGRHLRIWDGTDAMGQAVASGVYFYRMVTPEFSMARKMVLMK